MRKWIAALAVSGCLGGAAAAQVTEYPVRPITLIVPAAPGGVTDTLGRTLAQRFTQAWGHQAVVEIRSNSRYSRRMSCESER